MDFDFDQTVEILRSTPVITRGLVCGKSEAWVRGDYGPG